MKCMQCGNELTTTDKTCGTCGRLVDGSRDAGSSLQGGNAPAESKVKKSGTGLKVILVIVAVVVVNMMITKADRDESGVIIEEGDLDTMEMQVGDCFNDTVPISSEETVEIQSVHGLPCSDPHDNEVYAKFNMETDEFPGEEQILEIANDGCMDRFAEFVGVTYEESVLDVFYMFPTIETWTSMNDREIVCSVYHAEGEKLSLSMKGSNL